MMKMLRLVCLVAVPLGLAVVYSGCERHSYADSAPGKKDGTSNLYHGHGGDHGDGQGGGEAHEGKTGRGGGDEAHGEEKTKDGDSREGESGRKLFNE